MGSGLGETKMTLPGVVGVPSGMKEPEETQAAIWIARRDFPQPWSPSRSVMPHKGTRFVQSQRTG